MIWDDAKLIISRDTVDIDWLKLNVMCPVPIVLNNNVIRVYAAFCDERNRGRVGYVDVDRANPSIVLGISEDPCMDIGSPGTFDDSGVLPTCMIQERDTLYMYYCGFQKQVNVPYTSLLGIAVSNDGGNNFHRIKNTPVLERVQGELFIRTGAFCVCSGDEYELYYASGDEWFELYEGKLEPIYNLKRISTEDMSTFTGKGSVVINLQNDEYGITIPQYFKNKEKEQLLFSVRSCNRGYRLEYATKNLGEWVRQGEIGIADNATGWYREMQCFGKILRVDGRTMLFFSGNHYGIGGMGWTELIENKN